MSERSTTKQISEPALLQSEEPNAIPPIYASQFVIGATNMEVSVGLGQMRMLVQEQGPPKNAIEWMAALMLSPLTAKQLGKGLLDAVATWEKTAGIVIPETVTKPSGRG